MLDICGYLTPFWSFLNIMAIEDFLEVMNDYYEW